MITNNFSRALGLCLIASLQHGCNQNTTLDQSETTTKEVSLTETATYPEISINPYIKPDTVQTKIIEQLHKFLALKDKDPRSLSYWKEADYDNFMFPYMDIFSIEQNHERVQYFFKPTILEIIAIDGSSEYLIKIAFIGRKDNENYLKCIYNLIVDTKDYKFKRVLDYNIRNWERFTVGNIEYYNSPLKDFNNEEAETFDIFNTKIAKLFETEPYKVTYYSCVNTKELFEIKGFDFRHNMYLSETGGESDVYSDIVYSGKNSERYDHELAHCYLHKKFFKTLGKLRLLNEGLATFFGGSGDKTYPILRSDLSALLSEKNSIDVLEYLNPYYDAEEDNQISYTIGAILCERAIRLKGSTNFLDIFYSKNLDEVLDYLDLNRENLKNDLILELKNMPIESSSLLQ